MFKVQLKFSIALEGCPDYGIPAIDFRRKFGIPEAPDNMVKVDFERVDEKLCRKFADYCNTNGDLILRDRGEGYYTRDFAGDTGSKFYDSFRCPHGSSGTPNLYHQRIDPTLAKVFVRPDYIADDGHAQALLESLLSQAATRKGEIVAKIEADRKEKAERDAKDIAEYAAKKVEKDAKEAADIDSLKAWAFGYASETTRLRLEDGYDSWVKIARDEYADSVFDSLGLLRAEEPTGYEGKSSEPRLSPTAAEIKALRAVRKELRNLEGGTAELVRACYEPLETNDDTDTDAPIRRTEIIISIDVYGVGYNCEFLIPETAE